MGDAGDKERLERFVLRARRIAAHSLVQDRESLRDHARGQLKGHIDHSGQTTFIMRLPDNEEVFESLASRLRPLIVKSEPIYYVKVFGAIENLIDGSRFADPDRTRLNKLRTAWDATEIQSTQVRGYAMQAANLDGTEATNMVSDTQLAAAWLYADLVHADAIGPKKDGLAFSLSDRYAAAVLLFSRLAILTTETLQLIETLRSAGVLSVAESAWDEPVVIRASELVRKGKAFRAPIGTAAPDLRDAPGFSDEWTQVTVTELLRQNSSNQVRVLLADDSGTEIAAYEAAVTRRDRSERVAQWHVLVGGSMTFKFAFDVDGEKLTGVRLLGRDALHSTNELKLASTQLCLELHRATTVAFEVHGQKVLILGPSDFAPDELRQLEVLAQTLADIVALERITAQVFAPCNGTFNDRDRVTVRRLRLMREGKVVHAMRHPVTVTSTEGNPPQVIVVEAGTLDIGGAQIPTPTMHMRHRQMIAKEETAAPDVGPAAKKFTMELPGGDHFIAWAPDHTQVTNDAELVVNASWGLLDIDEATFDY